MKDKQMSDKFKNALERTLGLEGGYSNHANDKGGATAFGITESVARANGYKGNMKDFTLKEAAEIYHKDYWKPEFEEFGPLVSSFLFDCNVNHGFGGMSEILQKSINSLTRKNVDVDRYAGSKTYSAAKALNQERLYVVLNGRRAEYFLRICDKNETQEDFIYGWLSNRVFWKDVTKLIKVK